MKKNNTLRFAIAFSSMVLLLQFTASAQQQVQNSMSQYFRSRMLWNAGFTGADGNKLYAFQNRSWVGFDGAPVTNGISGEFKFGQNAAVGVQLITDMAGVLYRTAGVLNYAYRIKITEEKQVRIGISLDLAGDRLNSKYIDENGAVDPLIVNSIDSRLQFDANIGGVYTHRKLTIGLSFYRLSENLSGKNGGNANLAFAQLGATYDINAGDEKINLKPLVMLRLFRNTNAVMDLGAQLEYTKLVNAMLIYQSSGNIRLGAGLVLKELGEANFFYNTNIKVANSASQQYELGIGLYLKKKRS